MPTIDRLPRAFRLRVWSYFLDFVVMPPLAVALLWHAGGLGVAMALAFVCGVIVWTLAEYLIHRFAFHSIAVFVRMHDAHHARPKDWIGVATWGTALAFGVFWLGVYCVSTAMLAGPLTAGVIAGYLFYCGIHIRFHHGASLRMGRYVAFMARHHNGHHRGGRGNFGVSSPLWDIAFGTYKETTP